MKGLLIFNKYYSDAGQAYIRTRLTECFSALGVSLLPAPSAASLYAGISANLSVPKADFALFWDKDIALARYLERSGLAVYNCADAIELCDDKRKTYEAAVTHTNVPLIPTLFAPLAYAGQADGNPDFLNRVETALGYPVIVKENVGSLGRQVYLAKNRAELQVLHMRLFTTPHQYQPLIGTPGVDFRVYTIGQKAVAAIRRKNPGSFVSNAAGGGQAQVIPLTEPIKTYAETLAKVFKLDFGAIDFLQGENGQYYFLEANSNAYFSAAEQAGARIAEPLAEYVCTKISKKI